MKNLKLNVNFTMQQIDAYSGQVKKEESVHNTVVNAGLDRVANLIGNLSDAGFDYLGIGTDNTAEQSSDTELGTEYTRVNVTPTNPSNGVIKYDYTFSVGSGVSQNIVEAGLFDQSGASGSTMLNRATFSSFTLDINNTLRLIITVTVTTS